LPQQLSIPSYTHYIQAALPMTRARPPKLLIDTWRGLPAPVRKRVRAGLTLSRRAQTGWEGVPVQFGDAEFHVRHESGSEFRRARDFLRREPEFIGAFTHAARRATVLYDIGANIGLFAMLGARLNSSLDVHAFEPEPRNFAALEANLDSNGLLSVHRHAIGLGAEDTIVEFAAPGEVAGTGTHQVRAARGIEARADEVIQVQIRSVDSLVAAGELPAPDLIKMDVEGYEAAVLRGMDKVLRENHPTILLELHPQKIAEQGDSVEALFEQLQSMGYEAELIGRPGDTVGHHSQHHYSFTVPAVQQETLGSEHRDHDGRPLISVVVPTHNRAELVERALHSVLQQTYRHLELIVVDDGSEDETPTKLAKLAASDPRVKIITNGHPLGGGAARNRGLEEARGEYVAYLDDDDVWFPEKLERQHRLAPYYSVVGCLSAAADRSGVGALRQRFMTPEARAEGSTTIGLQDVFYNNAGLCPSVALVRRDYLEQVGGFDDHLPGSQGRDLFVRLVDAFGPAIMVEEFLAEHFQGHGLGRISEGSAHLEGCWQVFEKHQHLMSEQTRKHRRCTLALREWKQAANTEDKRRWMTEALRNIDPRWPARFTRLFALHVLR